MRQRRILRRKLNTLGSVLETLLYFLSDDFAFEGHAVCVPIVGQNSIKALYPRKLHRLRVHGYFWNPWLLCTAATSPPAPPASVHHHRALPGTLADLPTLERLVCAPRATAEIFTGISAENLTAQLRWVLGDRPASHAPSANRFFVLERWDTPRVVAAANVLDNAVVAAAVHPLLSDGVEDASAVARAIMPALRNAQNLTAQLR
ncbi:hypothetical protein B0H17DRAFT_1192325 [Mycena rosella]|uniref:Uncharacterized protein n=1 Tax=Mycena rosella TaxID=1033263 RepID=A0AAD7GWD4_MYCRO|nr:hypothetical protein B0H17DRAFT_1192325 [Mycena rosella]